MGRILPDFLVRQPEGYYCRYGDFYLDPGLPVPHAVISHAHADHASPGHQIIYCTPPTATFMQHRYRRQPVNSFRVFSYDEQFTIGAVRLFFISAGHMLGSAQIVMDYDGVRYLYTGDYKMQADDTCDPLEVVQADVLITESTFAHPEIIHPDPVQEIMKINDCPHHILLGTYALGKAQRLTSLLNRYCPERTVLVHHSILPLHGLYASLGISYLRYTPYSRKAMKDTSARHIYLVPPMTFRSYRRATGVLRVFASGWKNLQHQNDMELYISDHVDWSDILSYVDQVKPREIWTMHGDGRHLADYYQGTIPVKPIYFSHQTLV